MSGESALWCHFTSQTPPKNCPGFSLNDTNVTEIRVRPNTFPFWTFTSCCLFSFVLLIPNIGISFEVQSLQWYCYQLVFPVISLRLLIFRNPPPTFSLLFPPSFPLSFVPLFLQMYPYCFFPLWFQKSLSYSPFCFHFSSLLSLISSPAFPHFSSFPSHVFSVGFW